MKSMNYWIVIVLILLSNICLANSDLEEYKYFEKYKHQVINTIDHHIKGFSDLLKNNQIKIKSIKERRLSNKDLLQNTLLKNEKIKNYILQVDNYIKVSLDNINRQHNIKKLIYKRKLNYLTCLKDKLNLKKYTTLTSCTKESILYLNSTDKEMYSKIEFISKEIDMDLELTYQQLSRQISQDEILLKQFNEKNKLFSNNIDFYNANKAQTLEILNNMENILTDTKFKSCDSEMPTIDLENEYITKVSNIRGVFHQIPQEQQGGIGTCYANTAKNLLLGLSRGVHNANYLDLAIQYKDSTDELATEGLEGGFPCNLLRMAKKRGYCKNSKITSNNNEIKTTEVISLALDLSQLENSLNMTKNTQNLIKDFISNKDLDFPVRPLRAIIFQQGTNQKVFKKSQKLKDYFENFDQFNTFLKAKDVEIKSDFIASIQSGQSIDHFIDRLINKKLYSTFQKYGETVPSSYIRNARNIYTKYLQAKKFKQLKESVIFMLDNISSLKRYSNQDIDLFYNEILSLNDHLSIIQKMSKYIQLHKIDHNILFDSNGSFKDLKTLLSLLAAPNCIDESDRTSIDNEIKCVSDYNFVKDLKLSFPNSVDLQEKFFQLRIKASLLKGLPLGNIFYLPYGLHVNTIVGMKYNKSTDRCELKMRDSQDVKSKWVKLNEVIKYNKSVSEIL